ncbi:protein ARK2N isoform X2 [Amia ocellicauda]|uniref:protein ARK2N isoform X2 n=1 Tax=Amia ocellicauda TaxID=2972642 RepID=UPI003464205C
MKMADTEKTEELVDSETPPEAPADRPAAGGGAVAREDEPLKTETSPSEKEGDSPLQTDPSLMSSMPCLLMELRRDSPESQRASTESEKPPSNRTYESDSSNPCLLSPSSSGHLADSDTLSSGEEAAAGARGAGGGAAEGAEPGLGAGGPAAVGGRKSRRSRSESEMSSAAMAAKKNRWQAVGGDKHNGRLAKVKGQRSQKHKQRMRLLRQKREAAARKKYNLLQDSSTSDSDLTCDSSSSSSDDDDEVSGSSKTITADIPDGPAVIAHYDISDTNSDPEGLSVDSLLAAAVAHELKTFRPQGVGANSWAKKGHLGSSCETGHIEAQFGPGDQQTCGPLQIKEEINIASTDSEVEIVGVQENTRCVHPRGGVIQSLSSWKHGAVVQYSSARQSHLWTAVSPQPSWASPPEVVDLTLDEDARRKYLL